jgi:hypothetical protein
MSLNNVPKSKNGCLLVKLWLRAVQLSIENFAKLSTTWGGMSNTFIESLWTSRRGFLPVDIGFGDLIRLASNAS